MFDQWFVILRGSSPIANLWKILKDRSCVTGDAVCTDSPPSWHAFWQTWNTRILCLPSKTLKDQASRRKEKVLRQVWPQQLLTAPQFVGLQLFLFGQMAKGTGRDIVEMFALFWKETNWMMYCSCIFSGTKKIQIPWNHLGGFNFSRWWLQTCFIFTPYLRKWSNLTATDKCFIV